MVGITPLGAFSFISKLWTGSTSDTHITQESGLLHLLGEGDHVMTDRGFMDLFTKKVVLNMPLLSLPTPVRIFHFFVKPFGITVRVGKYAQFGIFYAQIFQMTLILLFCTAG